MIDMSPPMTEEEAAADTRRKRRANRLGASIFFVLSLISDVSCVQRCMEFGLERPLYTVVCAACACLFTILMFTLGDFSFLNGRITRAIVRGVRFFTAPERSPHSEL